MLSAKPVLNVVVSSAAGQNNACNDGLINWCLDRFGNSKPIAQQVTALGQRILQVFDDRQDAARPEDALISNLAEDTSNSVRWFDGTPPEVKPDLGIIAQLEASNASAESIEMGSPLGVGGLIRHRVRRQLRAASGAFLCESRMGVARPPSDDGLCDRVMNGLVRLENLGDTRYGYTFAPNVHAIQSMLRQKRADFAAVSSSAVDPACFLGDWLDDAYLWDYDLPSYSHRAGDTNGYYLLSQIKEVDREALRTVLGRLPGCESLQADAVEEVMLEVARRGMPTVRGLSAGDFGAAGDLGLFIAARLLQDEFRKGDRSGSLLPILAHEDRVESLALLIPVDPFQGYLEDLQAAVGKPQYLRPDLVVAAMAIQDSSITCRLTPVEVKFRGREVMSAGDSKAALQQAQSLSTLLGAIRDKGSQPDMLLWRLAFQHLLVSMVGFSFRVYSQQRTATRQAQEWGALHQHFVEALLAEEVILQIDPRGRLIVMDESPTSMPRDVDGDGFKETIVLSAQDASRIVRESPEDLYSLMRGVVGTWDCMPTSPASPRMPEPVEGESTVVAPISRAVGSASEIRPADQIVSPPEREETVPQSTEKEPEAIPPVGPPGEGSGAGVNIVIGNTVDGFKSNLRCLNLSDTRLNQLNIGVVGDLGTGKTQLLKSLIYQTCGGVAANQGVKPRFLIFDYKIDYSKPDFVKAVGARVVKPYRLPLNLFDVAGVTEGAAPWLGRFRFFADVLDKIYSGIGPVQRQQLKNAVRQSYDDCKVLGRQPTIYDVHANYRTLLGGKVDSPLGIIDDLVDMELFAREPMDSSGFDKFLDGVVVIALDQLGQDDHAKNMLVAIMLNMFYEHMLKIPKRPYLGSTPQLRVVDSYLLVDEADNIMRYEFDVLKKVLLQGREFGVGVILASQYLKNFKAGATDYREPLLTWLIHKVPNVTPQELAALGFSTDVGHLAERVKTLENHHCLFKTFNVPGEVVKDVPFYELAAQQLRADAGA
jgi:hypothetical protein